MKHGIFMLVKKNLYRTLSKKTVYLAAIFMKLIFVHFLSQWSMKEKNVKIYQEGFSWALEGLSPSQHH
jgi:hypothetical protein